MTLIERSRRWFRARFERDQVVVLLIALSALLTLFLWLARAFWYQFSPMISWFGIGVVLVNAALAGSVIDKQPVFAQAIAFTALTVAILLVVLVVRTAAVVL